MLQSQDISSPTVQQCSPIGLSRGTPNVYVDNPPVQDFARRLRRLRARLGLKGMAVARAVLGQDAEGA